MDCAHAFACCCSCCAEREAALVELDEATQVGIDADDANERRAAEYDAEHQFEPSWAF